MANANERIIQMVQSGQITTQQAENLFKQAGINVAPGGGARTRYLNATPQANQRLNNMLSAFGGSGQGAMPIGIEPLSRGEREGYRTMLDPGLLGGGGMAEGQQRIRDFLADPQKAIQVFLSPEAKQALQKSTGMYDKADSALQEGMSEIEESDFSRFMNPFQQQVIDVALAQLEEDYQSAQDKRMAELNRRPSASFGDLFGAEEMASLAEQRLQSRAEIPAKVGYQGWIDTLAALEREKERSLGAGQTYGNLGVGLGNLATQAQNVYSNAASNALAPTEALYETGRIGTQVGFDAAQRKINAGRNIRQYNQTLADITMGDYMNSRAFPRTNLTQTMDLVPSFATKQYGTPQIQNVPNTAFGLGQALTGLGSIEGIGNTQVGRWFEGLF